MKKIKILFLTFLSLTIFGCASRIATIPTTGIEKGKPEKEKKSACEEAVERLEHQVIEREIERLKVSIGKITCEDTDISSSCSAFLSSELSMALMKSNVFEEISRKNLEEILEEQKLSLSGLIDPSESFEVGRIKGVDAILTGNYWEEERNLRVNLFLVKVVTGEKIAGVTSFFPKKELPQNVSLKPNNFKTALDSIKEWQEIKSEEKDFRIRVWPEKGEGAVYREDEEIVFNFRTNKDCYVYLYHTDTEGSVKLLFPNRYKRDNFVEAGEVYSLPDESMGFAFKVEPPFGIEMVKAIASLQPIKGIETTSEDEAFRSVGQVGDQNFRGLIRAIKVAPKTGLSESLTTITTLGK